MCTTASPMAISSTAPSPKMPGIPAQSPLPIQTIPRTTSSRIEDPKGKLIAVGGLVRYSTNQAYFILQHLDVEFTRGKTVTVYTPNEDTPLNLKVNSVHDCIPDRSHMRMYLQVHWNPEERLVLEHLFDALSETALGRRNLELKKNITIDVFDSDGDAFTRDCAGFIVSDRLQLHQVTIDGSRMMMFIAGRATGRAPVVIEEVSSAERMEELLSYDASLSPYNRAEFLDFLLSKTKAYLARSPAVSENGLNEGGADAPRESSAVGYIVTDNDYRVLGLYAESQAVAEALVEHHLKKSGAKKLVFCTSKNHWRGLEAVSSFESRVIYRRHTRALPPNVKWEKIFAINVGINLF